MYNPLPNSFTVRKPDQQDQSNKRFDGEKDLHRLPPNMTFR